MKVAVLALFLAAFPAAAYPSSVFFAPTGEARAEGTANAFVYAPVSLRLSEFGDAWAGMQVGLLPVEEFQDFSVGGAEVGLDVIMTRAGPKPVFNGKVQVFGAQDVLYVGVGVLNASPIDGLNLGYVSASVGDFSTIGRFTAGLGATAAGPEVFRQPVYGPDFGPLMLWIGYESIQVCDFYLTAETISGVSEVSGSNFAMTWLANESVRLTGGLGLPNEHRLNDAVVFVNLSAELATGE